MLTGTRLGPYEIVAPLGAGGMGEVYRATDVRLKRQVAVKILPATVAADPERLARFQREAEILASLNHPHIAAVYGLEEVASSSSAHADKALVMELVEGPTLADRIAQGPIPVDETLAIARQIAAALEAAHEQGIVHRDLKPANIKVREDGTVKVLDFGLAKLAEAGMRAAPADLSNSPTITAAANTGMGVILGTAAYMSPEQARGRAVDKRTDVWAFGAVLYEMLTGKRAFDGEDVTEMMASVVKSTPDWTTLPADTPPHVVTLIQRCLEKDRSARIGDIAVARFLLSDHAKSAVVSAPPPTVTAKTAVRGITIDWRMVVALIFAFVLVSDQISDWLRSRRETDVLPVARLQMSVAPAEQLMGSPVSGSVRPVHTSLAISPDGRRVVFTGATNRAPQLYSRDLNRTDAAAMSGTEGADAPFFSPDGAWVGFWAGNTLKKVAAAGGPPVTISDVPEGLRWGATWAEDGTIYFARSEGIFKVSAAGGSPTQVTTAGNDRHLLPHALPGAKAIVFTKTTAEHQSGRRWDQAAAVLLPLSSGEQRVLIPGGVDARYVPTGHLVYMKNGTLMAVPFNASSHQIAGAEVALIENVMQSVNTPNTDDETGAGQFAVSRSGTLLYATGGISPTMESRLVWIDRATGKATPLATASSGAHSNPRISPDGQRIAVSTKAGADAKSDIWVHDSARGAPTRLTFEGANVPTWSPDGRRIVYAWGDIYAINSDGSGTSVPIITEGDTAWPSSWVQPSSTLVYLQKTKSGAHGLWVLPMDSDAKPRLFLESRFVLWHPALSPDGRWMAYVSFESGGADVYVQAYPGPGEKIRISTSGGFDPHWTKNGRELMYRSGSYDTHGVHAVVVQSVSPFRVGEPRLVFKSNAGEYDTTAPERSWDVTADGERMLLLAQVKSSDKPVTAMHVVLNWAEDLRERVPAE